MSAILDDMDSRPGSATSLLRTVVGTYLRGMGGWIAVSHLVELMRTAGVSAPRTRTALSRVKNKGLLTPEVRDGVPGYRLLPEAVPMLVRGDRRIYTPRWMTEDDRWCLISYSVPEENRGLRHQLRRRLHWIGCGSVSPALWVCPEYLAEEVQEIVDDLGPDTGATLFLVDEVRGSVPLARQVATWWDLDAIGDLHEAFVSAHGEQIRSLGTDPKPERAFATWISSLDTWRIIPYLDPGLPASLLPADWPGKESIPLFDSLQKTVLTRAAAHVRAVTGRENPRTGSPEQTQEMP
ncbi:PaaX family transcriptional regulator C-terminal domain-containing protein [Streptomyces sp. NPDC047000]|uniref:PaaX family transcriptional regulator n=1 Tax=Streptomyces sp. NPDC047000 TaxID=3155474 RepID=UPI00340D25C5